MELTRCDPPCIHPDQIIGANAIRNLAGRDKPISRNTLKAWRDRTRAYPFPEPIRVLEGAGPGGSNIELWDLRAVTAWLNS